MNTRSWDEIQEAVTAWQVANFGRVPDWHMVLGVAEEFGEFAASTDFESRADAMADIAIYAMALCSNLEISFGSLLGPRAGIVEFHAACGFVGVLSRAALKREQKIRGFDVHTFYKVVISDALAGVLQFCNGTCEYGDGEHVPAGTSFISLVDAVAAKVTRRDWVNNPTNAHEKAV